MAGGIYPRRPPPCQPGAGCHPDMNGCHAKREWLDTPLIPEGGCWRGRAMVGRPISNEDNPSDGCDRFSWQCLDGELAGGGNAREGLVAKRSGGKPGPRRGRESGAWLWPPPERRAVGAAVHGTGGFPKSPGNARSARPRGRDARVERRRADELLPQQDPARGGSERGGLLFTL